MSQQPKPKPDPNRPPPSSRSMANVAALLDDMARSIEICDRVLARMEESTGIRPRGVRRAPRR